MAWIKVTEEEESEGELKEVYDRIKRELQVPRLSSAPRAANVLKVQGQIPEGSCAVLNSSRG